MVLTVALVGGQAWAGFGVGVYLGDLFEEWVPAPDSDEVSGTVTVRYTCDGDPPYQDAFFIALPPGGDEPSDWRCVPGWTPVGPLPAGGQHAVSEEIRTAIWRDGTWEVWVALARWIEEGKDGGEGGGVPPSPDPDVPFPSGVFPPEDPELMIVDEIVGPFHFTAKNLSVTGLSMWGDRVTLLPPFVSVGPHDDTTFSITSLVDDGFECPEELDDHFTLRLSGLGSTGISYIRNRPSDAAVPDPVDSWTAAFDADTWPGLYYVNSLVNQEGNGDEDEWLSKYLTVTDVQPAIVNVEPALAVPTRRIHFAMDVTTEDATEEAIFTGQHVWRRPDGALTGAGGLPPYFSDCQARVTLEWLTCDIAGDYTFGASYLDEHGPLYHNGQNRWAVPGGWTFEVPAAMCSSEDIADDEMEGFWCNAASGVYALLGEVYPAPNGERSFYSARDPEGERGGWVHAPTFDTYMEALQYDHIVAHFSHGNAAVVELNGVATPMVICQCAAVDLLPEGSCSQLRLYLGGHCYSYSACNPLYPQPGETVCAGICASIVGRGAQAALGFGGCCTDSGDKELAIRAFSWLRQGKALSVSATWAMQEMVAAGWDPIQHGLADNPDTHPVVEGVYYHNGGQVIAPAFTAS